MSSSLNSPHRSESFAGDELGDNLVVGSFETSEYLANKGLVTPWLRNRHVDWTDASTADKYISEIRNWKNDTID